VWHKKGVKARRSLVPLDGKSLQQLALRYVGRFATTRAKLRAYLARNVRERGWNGSNPPDFEALAERFAALGYVDDAAYALAKSRSLTGRGFGKRRVVQALHIAGIGDEDGEAARGHAEVQAVTAALRFAERRRIGPFAVAAPSDPKARQKALAAMTRAGHGFGLARAIVDLRPGVEIDREELAERFRNDSI
jgi:regulatory protein